VRVASLISKQGPFIGVRRADGYVDLNAALPGLAVRDVGALLRSGALEVRRFVEIAGAARDVLTPSEVRHRPILASEGRVLCLGLNYVDHAAEGKFETPKHPVIFARFASSFVGHDEPLVRPSLSEHFDYEAELAVVMGQRARHVSPDSALAHVAGYTLMNDGSVRDYQMRTSQWTLGKNFDASGSIGPELVTADELPPGARGLRLEGRLNGAIMQSASTDDMIFDVATTIERLSEAMTLEPGDVIALGTPAGVGFARTPPVFLRPKDVFEVSVERVGTLRNHVIAEPPSR
jgi:2-keto-4-pentenoate hydratase/2-oxohepta-3-ene-1,7-dioic acid hydratase in catechol pathway